MRYGIFRHRVRRFQHSSLLSVQGTVISVQGTELSVFGRYYSPYRVQHFLQQGTVNSVQVGTGTFSTGYSTFSKVGTFGTGYGDFSTARY